MSQPSALALGHRLVQDEQYAEAAIQFGLAADQAQDPAVRVRTQLTSPRPSVDRDRFLESPA